MHYLNGTRITYSEGMVPAESAIPRFFCQNIKESLRHLASAGIVDTNEKDFFHILSMDCVGLKLI